MAKVYEFGDVRFDPAEHELRRGGNPVPLPPKALDLLLALVEEPGRLRTRDELLQRVWSDVIVDESNLSQNVFLLRKAFGDDGDRWIVTVPRRGYRFAAAVRVLDDAAPPPPAAPEPAALTPRPRRAWLALAAVALLVLVAAAAVVIARRNRAPAPIHSIAVLPFRDLDDRHADRAMELGIADTLINKLSELPQLVVSPTRAVSAYLDRSTGTIAAGRELGVDAVLEGNLQRGGERLRCTVRLLRVADGAAVWADEFSEPVSDLFDLEDRIAERTATALDLRLNHRERGGLAKRYTRDRDAYALYERGRLEWASFDPARLVNSVRYFEAALQRDPQYALAYTGLANAYSVIGIYGPLPADESFARAREAALRAIEIDPDLAPAHSALAGSEIFRGWHWDVAESELKRAMALDANLADAHSLYAYVLEARGRTNEALAEAERTCELDPTWQVAQYDRATALFVARRYPDCIRLGKRLLALQPDDFSLAMLVARADAAAGDLAGARTLLLAGERAKPNDVRALSLLGTLAARSGDRAEAMRRIAQIEALQTQDRTRRAPYQLSWIYAALGNRDFAFAALDVAFRQRYPFLWRARTDPELDPLRGDARMARLLEKLGL